MKCSKCGEEIANDSVFCEYCGTKVMVPTKKNPQNKTRNLSHNSTFRNNKTIWIVLAAVLSSFIVISVLLGSLIFLYCDDSIRKSSIMTDAQQMNIHGSIKKITETSYYSIESEDKKNHRNENGGFFDDCAFLSIVYGGEHLARVNFRNFFLHQVSDCIMKFNKDGNLYDLSSLNSDGGHVILWYDGEKLPQQMDVMERMNGEQEITDYVYEYEDNNLVRELQTQRKKWGEDRGTLNVVNYIYASDKLVKAKTDADYYYVDYLSNGRIGTIHFPKYKKGQDLIINIGYDSNNNIASVDWDKGLYGKAHTEFSYKYDSPHGNWFERNAIGTIERDTLKNISFSIRTVREYEYY